MKKIITIILTVSIVLSIFLPNKIIAYSDTEKSKAGDMIINKDQFMEDSEKGSSDVAGTNTGYNISKGTQNSVIKNLVKIFNVLPSTAKVLMDLIAKNTPVTDVDRQYGNQFSIQKLVFNKINLFDINFFTKDSNDTNLQIKIKENISSVYYLMRNIAIVSFLVILIYVGIRMAIASVATEKAKYKKMLVGWASSFVILLILPYVMIALLKISQIIMDFCESIMISLCGGNISKIEEDLLGKASNSSITVIGSYLISTLVYWILVFYQLKFFWMYAKRLFATGFLIVISPLVLVQYAFDKAGDGEASSFKIWLTEMGLNIFIQPIHAVLYMVFMSIASNIIEASPILAVIFLSTMSRGERVIRNIINVKNSNTVQSMSDSAINHKKIMDVIGR